MRKLLLMFVAVTFVCGLSHMALAKQFEGYKKVNTQLRGAWKDLQKRLDAEVVECLVRTITEVNDRQKNELSKAGFRHRSIIRNIITGSIPTIRLPDLAKLDFVVAVEGAVPLGLKTEPVKTTK